MDENEPEDFKPIIPPWLRSQYESLPPMEKEKYNTFSIIDQKMDWQIKRMREAIDHRTYINKEVAELKEQVQPAVRLASLVWSMKGMLVAFMTLVGIPLLLRWLEVKIK